MFRYHVSCGWSLWTPVAPLVSAKRFIIVTHVTAIHAENKLMNEWLSQSINQSINLSQSINRAIEQLPTVRFMSINFMQTIAVSSSSTKCSLVISY